MRSSATKGSKNIRAFREGAPNKEDLGSREGENESELNTAGIRGEEEVNKCNKLVHSLFHQDQEQIP